MKKLFLVLLILLLGVQNICAENFLIYAIGQKVPSGAPNEKRIKSYFINMGENQGLRLGTQMRVFRTFSPFDPFHNNRQYPISVKIGKMEIIHVEAETSIGKKIEFLQGEDQLPQEYQDFMLGDLVNIFVQEKVAEREKEVVKEEIKEVEKVADKTELKAQEKIEEKTEEKVVSLN